MELNQVVLLQSVETIYHEKYYSALSSESIFITLNLHLILV